MQQGAANGDMDSWQIVHIPDKPPVPPNQQPTVAVLASVIEPNLANALIRRLNQIAPLENLRHVKRIRKNHLDGGKIQLSAILCIASGNASESNNLSKDLQDIVHLYKLSPFITKVCRYAATSKEDWEEQCKLWPTSYHPPTYNIDGITGFSEEDSETVFGFMKVALQLAKFGDGPIVNAAVIVDPSVKQIISSSRDQICSWHRPTNKSNNEISCTKSSSCVSHINSRDISNCATLAPNALLEEHEKLKGAACLNPCQWVAKPMHKDSSFYWHPLRHAAIVAIELSSERDRGLFPTSGHSLDNSLENEPMQSSVTDSPAKRQKTSIRDYENEMASDFHLEDPHSKSQRPYLCTGYDIFLVWEPCTMCAMALVHQRVRRIFYMFSNPTAGALGSFYRLQGERSLNHRYAVFRILPSKEVVEI